MIEKFCVNVWKSVIRLICIDAPRVLIACSSLSDVCLYQYDCLIRDSNHRGSLGSFALLALLLIGDADVIHAGNIHLHCRCLLLEVIKVIFSLSELSLGIGQVLAQENERVLKVVLDHDVGAQPKTDFASIIWNLSLRPDIIRDQEIGINFVVTPIMLLF